MATQTSLDVRRHLSSDEINALPLYHYEGPVHLIRDLRGWKRVRRELTRAAILGFDTETRPTFRKGKVNDPALVQLATDNAVYLVQLSWLPFGPYLAEVLADASIVKAGVGIRFDMQTLARLSPFVPAGLVDLGLVARMNKFSSQGLRTLSAAFFGWRISKGSQCSNWNLTELTPRQIVYAATDAWVSRLIYLKMRELNVSFVRSGEKKRVSVPE